jgi:hypothetical protein
LSVKTMVDTVKEVGEDKFKQIIGWSADIENKNKDSNQSVRSGRCRTIQKYNNTNYAASIQWNGPI